MYTVSGNDLVYIEDEENFVEESDNVSSGQINIIVPTSDPFDFNNLYDTLANVPGFTVYPSTQSVSVFTDVLNGLDSSVGYVIMAGGDSNDNYMYYSERYNYVGNTITLFSPVTMCRYYSYRPSNVSSYLYTYNVTTTGDTSIDLTNFLIYTNIVDGYPDVIPYKSKESYNVFIVIVFLFVLLILFISRRRSS